MAGGTMQIEALLIANSCPPRRSSPFGSLGFVGLLLSSLDGGCVVVPWSVDDGDCFGVSVIGAQSPLASNTVFSGHVVVDGGGAVSLGKTSPPSGGQL